MNERRNAVRRTVDELWAERQRGEEWRDAPAMLAVPFYEKIQHICEVFAKHVAEQTTEERIV
jgi:hypothetical protein